MPSKRRLLVDGHELALSNADKVYFPETGFTKGEVLAYYDALADTILPHLRDRPLTLKRYPDGVDGKSFYEKNAPVHTPDWVQTFAVPRSEGGPDIRYLLCNDRATLLWATGLGDIEKHVLLARAPALNLPTSLVFDLDPGEPATLLDCGRVALHLRTLFDAWGLQSFVKVSGSKGLHLNVPLNAGLTYQTTQPFAKAVAELAAKQLPGQVVSAMSKAVRRGKVLIDWSQNSDFKTTVSVYAMRARHGPPHVSAPVTWDELAAAVKRGRADRLRFSPAAVIRRVRRRGDGFAPVLTLRQTLPAVFTEALAAAPPVRLSSWPGRDKSLREYTAKRDLARTPEPPAAAASSKERASGGRFVIQKHEASRLHYDLRLEMEGVLRSWAVPKGVPTTVRETRLAVHVEDHPLAYADFEGTIPRANYGAGTVMVWDRGTYEDESGDAAGAFRAGKMHFRLRGAKLDGEWILVKDRRGAEEGRWLLIKAGTPQPGITAQVDDTSAKSGRSMREIAAANDAPWRGERPVDEPADKGTPDAKPRTARRGRGGRTDESTPPAFIEPMQCEAVKVLPADGGWAFELKFDGYRAIAVKTASKIALYSRNRNVLNDRFPAIVDALRALPGDWVLDGEIVAPDADGRPSFQLLQNSRSQALPVLFYAFDLLNRDGKPLTAQPLEERRLELERLLATAVEPLRLSPLLQAPADRILDAVHQLGLEGLVGKRLGSPYEPGERSGAWIKHRADRQQEFVIGGYVPGARGFDTLLVGVYEGKRLRYVAKVRNGFVPRTREALWPALRDASSETCPFGNLPEVEKTRWGEPLTAEKMKACRWVKPRLVCQVAFVEWTEGGKLRHCTFLGMRDDKRAGTVRRET